jgi:hypothetical protein
MHLPDLRKWLALARRRHAPAEAAPIVVEAGAHEEAPEDPHERALRERLEAVAAATPNPAWTPRRLEVTDLLWGKGCMWPGGTEEVMRMAVPFGLSGASSLLLVGAGGGGPALRLAGELGVWVGGFEADPVLLEVAADRLHGAGAALAKRTSVQPWNPAVPAFRKQAFHFALSIEALRGPATAQIVAAIRGAVKPGGQVSILETVAPQPLDAHDPIVAAWCRLEHRAPPPPGTDWVTAPMSQSGFDIRVTEDVTARHARYAVTGWKLLLREMKTNKPPRRRAAAVVAEAEYWMRRIELLRTGRLRVMRWLAIHDGRAKTG